MPNPTPLQWIRQAARRLQLPDAQREARALLLAVLGRNIGWLYRQGDGPLLAAELERLQSALQRRADGEPLAYITGEKPFWDMRLAVSPHVLCPRPETELLVEACLEKLRDTKHPRVVDLGTGSGAIALALARSRPDARVLGTDTSRNALCLARENGRRWAPTVQWVQTGWLTGLRGPFQLIAANPPYIRADDPWLNSDGTRHEPRQALVAQQDGLADLATIIRQAPDRLAHDGWLILEHGHDQANAVRQALLATGLDAVECRRDLAGLPRVSLARRRG